jgi:hypothetical protein
VLPAASLASTRKVCAPSARPAYVFGLAQSASAPPSRAQRNVAPGSDEKEKEAEALADGSAGLAEIVTVGADESSVQPYETAALSLPARSVATTTNVCAPSARPV